MTRKDYIKISLWFAENLPLDYKKAVDTTLDSKHPVWYISKPSSPDHLRGMLHLASSASRNFSHFSFQLWNLAYNESSTVKSMPGPSINC